MNKFKIGDKIFKKRPYSVDRYCRFGGDDWEVPLGTQGKITICYSSTQYAIKFDNGVSWSVDESEIEKPTTTLRDLIEK